ncbi:hypothetical protein C8A05DRAFT_44509 [Staphylotrichum tortipilum]|uniref:BAH domain-containing protein n=1 Tax=Staphylotrichum tortipilum TaxID=2831512 RepID=A0AAN6ML05_9PEZI|nr:hypothetical protein C8A05DRAFT_44509 [Staphylotrichum longicolle]
MTECPFTITFIDPNRKGHQRTKDDSECAARRSRWQRSPFEPWGNFNTYDTMDLSYQVNPPESWTEMTRYGRFDLGGEKYSLGNFVYVANDRSIAQQKVTDRDDWVAYILEIRASDADHVYARIYWMYRPNELPPGTYDGTRIARGRQSYHGTDELIASNHMDIIDVFTITSKATVEQWDEGSEEIKRNLYWRQAYDVRTRELSVQTRPSLRTTCGATPRRTRTGRSLDVA